MKMTLFAAALASVFATQAGATTINLPADNQWHEFDVDDLNSLSGGLEWIDNVSGLPGYTGDGSSLSFSFTLATPALLRVIDGGFGGDVFNVYSNGNLLGTTSAAAVNTYPASVGTDFDAAWLDASYSRAEFTLAPGIYSITGNLATSVLDDTGTPINATIGAVQLTAVPVPAAWGLFLVGSALLGAASRRRSN